MVTSPGKKYKKSRASQKSSLKNLEKAHKKNIDWVKREKYRTNRLLGMNRYQAARAAGYAETTARSNASRFDRQEKIGILKALHKVGATDILMANRLFHLAETATKMQSCTVEVRDEEGNLTINDSSRVEVPDLHLRKECWELIAKLKKHLTPSSIVPDGKYTRLTIVVEKEPEIDNRPANSSDPPTVSRVALTD